MNTFANLADALNGIASDLTAVQTHQTAQDAAMKTLQDELAAAGTTLSPAAQTALDSAVASASNIKTAMDQMVANFNATAAAATTAAGGNTTGQATTQTAPATPAPAPQPAPTPAPQSPPAS
jgi:uncharacterized phage infection (PIP) family protein YhgE